MGGRFSELKMIEMGVVLYKSGYGSVYISISNQ